MKRIRLMICLGIIFIISLIFVCYFYLSKQFIACLLMGIVSIIIGTAFFVLYFIFKSDKTLYKDRLKELLEKYKEILQESVTMPNLEGKKVIIVGSMDELLILQKQLKKTIYYKKELGCCAFFLMDSDEVGIYILKVNDGVISDLEMIMSDVNNNGFGKVFAAINKNVVIKLENSRVFKISSTTSKIDFDDENEEDEII